jgi:glycosyltransferase involved in cell wall biosynthesis
MRILAVTNMYPTPGRPWAGTFIEQQVESLRKAGADVDLLFVDRLLNGLRAYRGLARAVREREATGRPDIVHVLYGGFMADVVTRAVRSTPVIVSFCGSDLLGEPIAGFVRRLMARAGVVGSRRAARRAAGIIVKSENLLNALPEGIEFSRVAVIPNGIDLDRFAPSDLGSCRAKLGWDPGRRHVLFPSVPENQVKRYTLACAAVDRLRSRGQAVELHAMPRVPHGEVPTWLNAADCLLLTSAHEGSPNIVKEALACNRPVVSVDVGDVRQRIEGVRGCAVAPSEPDALADALARTLEGGHRSPGGAVGRTRVEELSIERVAARVMNLYAAVRGRSAHGTGAAPTRAAKRGEVA